MNAKRFGFAGFEKALTLPHGEKIPEAGKDREAGKLFGDDFTNLLQISSPSARGSFLQQLPCAIM
jgi:hypothetical protein